MRADMGQGLTRGRRTLKVAWMDQVHVHVWVLRRWGFETGKPSVIRAVPACSSPMPDA